MRGQEGLLEEVAFKLRPARQLISSPLRAQWKNIPDRQSSPEE